MASSSEPNIDDSAHSNATLQQSKRKKITHKHQRINQNSPNLIPWRSQSEQRIYSTNLIQALRRRLPSPAARQIRDTADRVLARAAKGRTRWSRAILVSPRWKLRRNKVTKVEKGSNRLKRMRITGGDRKSKRRLPAMQKKARVLSGLVPGCKKVSFQNLLEETSDYISALEMQVKAMTALTELLAGRMVS